jgi:ABC-type antimicrobial peptide transport system permease subunit
MTINNQFNLIFKKLNKHLKSALFLILPVALLFGLSTLITSQVNNYSQAIDKAIFKTIANQSTVIQITKTITNQGGGFGEGGPGGGSRQDRNFTSDDVKSISSIPNVTSTLVNYTLPINRVESVDLVPDKTVDFQGLTVASDNTASLYTKESFNYNEGQEVPIILNSNSLIESYEEWGGQESIAIPLPQRGQGQQGGQVDFRAKFPIKTRPATIDKDKIIGQTFNINFGGLDKIQSFTQTPDFATNTITFKKLNASELEAKTIQIEDSVNKYWNYDGINKPLSYKFRVVGLITSDNARNTYVPESFTNVLMSNLIDNQLKSRNSTPFVNTELGVNYRGINYDGNYLQTSQGNNRFQGPGVGRPGQATPAVPAVTPVTIPGLVITTDANNVITGVGTDKSIFSTASKQAQNLTLKFNDVSNRDIVVQALNDKGYTYVDNGKFKVFSDLQNTLKNILNGTIIGFILLNLVILAFNVSKAIGDSRKEIGIFRALGFTKGQMITQYSLQSIVYTILGLILGAILGIVAVIGLSPIINEQFKGFIKDTITKTYGVTPEISSSAFTNINWNSTGLLAGILAMLAILISILLSLRISNISPSEAIKG